MSECSSNKPGKRRKMHASWEAADSAHTKAKEAESEAVFDMMEALWIAEKAENELLSCEKAELQALLDESLATWGCNV